MKNLLRSFLIALFLTINAWLFIHFRFPVNIFGLFLSTPLLIAVRQLGPRHITRFVAEPDKVPSSLFPYALSVPLVAGLAAVVYYKLRRGDTYFFSPYLENWALGEAALVLLLSSALVAVSLVIATSSASAAESLSSGLRSRLRFFPRGEFSRTSLGARVFQSHRSELRRFAVYLYAALYFWGIALLAASAVNDEWSIAALFILCSRMSLCLGITIVGVLFWQPFIVFFLIGNCVYAWALFNSLGMVSTVVFIGAMLCGAGIFLFILARWHAGRDPGYSVRD